MALTPLQAAMRQLDAQPSREAAATVLRELAASDLDDAAAQRHLDYAADRVMRALATRATIRLDSERIGALFLRWSRAVRAGFEVWLGTAPLWTGDCPRCDSALLTANDSYGMPTYFRKFRCAACNWRDEQQTGEPTLATLYSEMNAQEGERRVRTLRARPLESDATCWPYAGHAIEDSDPDPALAAVRGLDITSALLRRGKVDHLVLPARTFTGFGSKLAGTAVRSVSLGDATEHLTLALADPALDRLAGLGFHATDPEVVIDALLTAPARPQLRHLRIEGCRMTRKQLEAFAVSALASSLACFHVELEGVTTIDDRDYITFYSCNEDGCAVLALARRHPFLAPIAAALRTLTRMA